jgi:hypothetical protein
MEPEQALYVVRAEPNPLAILLINVRGDAPGRFEAPLSPDVASMIEEICVAAIDQSSSCVRNIRDGTVYYLETSGVTGKRSAVARTSAPGTEVDAVTRVFYSLRAYITAPPAVALSAAHTLIGDAESAYVQLGLFEQEKRRSR